MKTIDSARLRTKRERVDNSGMEMRAFSALCIYQKPIKKIPVTDGDREIIAPGSYVARHHPEIYEKIMKQQNDVR